MELTLTAASGVRGASTRRIISRRRDIVSGNDVGKDREAYEDMKKLSAQTYVPTFVRVISFGQFRYQSAREISHKHRINPQGTSS